MVFVAAPRCLVFLFFFFFSFSFLRLRCLWLSLVSGPECPGPRRCVLFALLASRFSALRALSPLLCFPPGRWLFPGGCCPPPPPFRVSRFSSPPLGAVCRVLCCAVFPWVRCCTALRRVVPSGVVLLCAVLLCCARFGAAACCAAPCGAARRPGALCFAALCFGVFPRAVCSVLCVLCRGVLLRAVVRRCALCCVCPGVLCCAFPFLPALCDAVLRCAGAVALCCRVVRAIVGTWCCGALLCVALFPLVFYGVVLGLVARGCLLVVCFGVGAPVWPCGLLFCGWCGLLWSPASLCRVL